MRVGQEKKCESLRLLLWKCAKCLAKDAKEVRHQDFRGPAKTGDICCGLGLHNWGMFLGSSQPLRYRLGEGSSWSQSPRRLK